MKFELSKKISGAFVSMQTLFQSNYNDKDGGEY